MLLLFLGIVIYLIIDDVKHKKEREYTNKRPTASSNSALTQQVNNNLRIMNDCLNVVNTSTNVETVISRYDDLIDVLERLSKYENNAAVTFPREVPSEVMVRLKGEKSVIINNAISRAFDDTLTKSETLKTEKGRRNRLLKFFVQLDCIRTFLPTLKFFLVATCIYITYLLSFCPFLSNTPKLAHIFRNKKFLIIPDFLPFGG